jgi:hypothetical protein
VGEEQEMTAKPELKYDQRLADFYHEPRPAWSCAGKDYSKKKRTQKNRQKMRMKGHRK